VEENPSFEQLAGPVQVRVSVTRTGQRLMVRGSVGFTARLDCALCGRQYQAAFDEPLSVEFVEPESGADGDHGLDGDDLDQVRLQGDVLDLAPLVRDAVHLAVPMAPRCRPDCQGVCPECGADRNTTGCTCQHR
jgi:uncharacterized protein